MKAFTKENFEAFAASQSCTDEDSVLISSQGMAYQVLASFIEWLEAPEPLEQLVKLPVKKFNNEVFDAAGELVMTCKTNELASLMVSQMNVDYLDEDDVEPGPDGEDEDE